LSGGDPVLPAGARYGGKRFQKPASVVHRALLGIGGRRKEVERSCHFRDKPSTPCLLPPAS
jgi:hypothetical protein